MKLVDLRRNNHYVPASYQRGFTDTKGKVWMRLADGTRRHLPPKSIGRERDLYIIEEHGVETDKVEVFFDRHVENQFAVLSRRIKDEQDKFSQMSGGRGRGTPQVCGVPNRSNLGPQTDDVGTGFWRTYRNEHLRPSHDP